MTIAAVIPDNEFLRLSKLRSYNILDTDFEQNFDRITALISEIYAAPIALVSLVDEDRQWFKSSCGLDARETGRDIAFCSHAILSEDVFYIEDATKDERFKDNPLVTGELNIRTYCGAPLIDPEGFRLGTLCLIYDEVTPVSEAARDQLKKFAAIAVDEILLRTSLEDQSRLRKEAVDNALSRSKFYASLVHDLKSPLNSVMGFSSLLQSNPSCSEKKIVDYASFIHKSGSQLLSMINTIMEASRLQAGEQTVDLADASLSDIEENCLVPLKSYAESEGKSLETEGWDSSIHVNTDADAMQKVITNIVDNAIKFSPTKGVITCRAKVGATSITFDIQDQGPGFTETGLKNFGRAYFTESHTLAPGSTGTGLGAFSAYKILELLSGTITAQNTKEGGLVTISLPYKARM